MRNPIRAALTNDIGLKKSLITSENALHFF